MYKDVSRQLVNDPNLSVISTFCEPKIIGLCLSLPAHLSC